MFDEILVVDYVTDINALTSDQLNTLARQTNESNLLNNCPNGTILGIPISSYGTGQPKVYYPFFSHMRMPAKAGERVWGFTPGGSGASYWLTRKVQDGASEDPNFTFEGRSRLSTELRGTQSGRETISSTFYDSGVSGAKLSSIIKGAVSRSEFVGEPVVAIKNKSTEISLQGSGNAAIKIGDNSSTDSATIDIIAGISSTKNISTIQNNASFTGKSYTEIVKPIVGSDSSTLSAGNLSADDSSRIIVSQNFSSDSYYDLTGDDSGGQASVVLKSDCIRMIAKKDLKIIVGEGSDPSSIIMKSNGDIIITPSSTGVIKLGGEDATGAILASPDAIQAAGTVTGTPLVSTAGGIIGNKSIAGSGVFSTKILVKV